MQKTFLTHCFGCRVNRAEIEAIDKQMMSRGYVKTTDNPDIIIINTCAVTHKAERTARKYINNVKRTYPKTKIVLTGCAATYWLKHDMYSNLPADLIIDNTNKDYLVDLLEKRLHIKRNPQKASSGEPIADTYITSGRMMVKIQDGCHRFCTFCIVPYLRGLPQSRTIQDIISIINTADPIPLEVICTAINTEAFGKDTGERFIELIDAILTQTDIKRLSFGSIHPWSITDEFLAYYSKTNVQKKFVHFFHIPLQSGSNKILSFMKRVHNREDMLARTKKIHNINKHAFLATDIIVGFLGETDEDFKETYDFLAESPISKFHVFRFSKRNQTAAFFMANRIKEPSEKAKKERSQALIDLSAEKYQHFQESLIGYESEALVLEKKRGQYYRALLNNQMPVLIKDKNIKERTFQKVQVTDIDKNGLVATII